ncbi:hypothetical protein SLEP1_g7437 [Rubroshorea leprosula]|uniref:Uncharacterized protein n=1 Tax=Rubroshorea leprosula TaxID=152421 RepID=A0AAV5HYF1_9ROSI|nr:hypothetical protein SLEP1_g7437 [Rubroshorea leprosula]
MNEGIVFSLQFVWLSSFSQIGNGGIVNSVAPLKLFLYKLRDSMFIFFN